MNARAVEGENLQLRNSCFSNKVKVFSNISNNCWTTHSGCVLQLTMYERFAEASISVWTTSEFPTTTLKYIFKTHVRSFSSYHRNDFSSLEIQSHSTEQNKFGHATY